MLDEHTFCKPLGTRVAGYEDRLGLRPAQCLGLHARLPNLCFPAARLVAGRPG